MIQAGPIRILAVDDDESSLASIRRIFRGHFDIVTTKDPVQALKVFELQGPFAVVISDYRMPVMNGIELFSRLIVIDRNVQRIMFTGHAELQMAIDAINHGKITAFLTKPTPAVSIRSVVMDAVRAYNAHRESLQPIPRNDGPSFVKSAPAELPVPLTVKEKEVLALLAKGCSNDEISLELSITVGTVKTHVNNLFSKLDVNSRSKIVARSIELGLIKTLTVDRL